MIRNPWRVGVLTVLSLLGVLLLAALGYGAKRGYEAFEFLNRTEGAYEKKPLTVAGFIELQLAREAQAAQAAAPAPKGK